MSLGIKEEIELSPSFRPRDSQSTSRPEWLLFTVKYSFRMQQDNVGNLAYDYQHIKTTDYTF